jgi:hypothetical protein
MPAGSLEIKLNLEDKNALREFAKFKKRITDDIAKSVSVGIGKGSKDSKPGRDLKKAIDKSNIKLTQVGGYIGNTAKMIASLFDPKSKKSWYTKMGSYVLKFGKDIASNRVTKYAGRAWRNSEINQKIGEGASAASQAHGQLASTTSGAFYSTVKGQMDMVKGVKDRVVDTYGKWKEYRAEKEARRKEEEDKKKKESGSTSSQPEQGEQASAESKRGGLISAAGSGVMFLEGAAKALGYALNFTSEAGQKYLTILKSQSATIGATGSYVGGGGEYFANQAIAQGQVSMNKAMGNYGNVGINAYGQFGDMKKFAAEQNMGFADFADAVGEFRRVKNDISVGFIKGIAKTSEINGLKQGDFIKEISGHIKSLRQKGYGTMTGESFKEFTGSTAGLGKELKGFGGQERAAQIMGQADVLARQAEGGGLIGALNLMQELQDNPNADIFEAKKKAEEKGYTEKTHDRLKGIFGDNKGAAGYVLGQSMGLSQKEGEAFYNMRKQSIQTDTSYQAGKNMGVDAQNKMEEGYMDNSGALQAAKTSMAIQTQQLEQLKLLAPAMDKVATQVEAIEKRIFNGMSTLINLGGQVVSKLF